MLFLQCDDTACNKEQTSCGIKTITTIEDHSSSSAPSSPLCHGNISSGSITSEPAPTISTITEVSSTDLSSQSEEADTQQTQSSLKTFKIVGDKHREDYQVQGNANRPSNTLSALFPSVRSQRSYRFVPLRRQTFTPCCMCLTTLVACCHQLQTMLPLRITSRFWWLEHW